MEILFAGSDKPSRVGLLDTVRPGIGILIVAVIFLTLIEGVFPALSSVREPIGFVVWVIGFFLTEVRKIIRG